MISLIFQLSLFALIFLSFVLVVAVPVVFAAPNGWNENRSYIVLGATVWIALIFLIGILNYFII